MASAFFWSVISRAIVEKYFSWPLLFLCAIITCETGISFPFLVKRAVSPIQQLLLFFLLVSQVDADKGIMRNLSPVPDKNAPAQTVEERNVLHIIIGSGNTILADDVEIQINELGKLAERFVFNSQQDAEQAESPQNAIFYLESNKQATYQNYVMVQNEILAFYRKVYNAESYKRFARNFNQLSEQERQQVQTAFPIQLTEKEPVEHEGEVP
jgi:biopolymer transport protein ExbD